MKQTSSSPPLGVFGTLAALVLSAGVARPQGDVVCAVVHVKLSQEAVLTKTVFDATLEIDNETTELITGFGMQLDGMDFGEPVIRDPFGNVANDLFSITVLEMTNLTSVSGDGVIAPQSTGRVVWRIQPLDVATPGADSVVYTVGGTVAHGLFGTFVQNDLFPSPITVHPEPALVLDYFLQRSVYSNSALTSTIQENPELFSLGLLLRNDGFGTARNLTIEAAQPELINPSGLPITMSIVGTQLDGNLVTPDLKVDFGDVTTGLVRSVRWLATTNWQGFFTNLEVSYTHLTGLGEPGLSAIESVNVFSSVHPIEINDAALSPSLNDGVIDFAIDAQGGGPGSGIPDPWNGLEMYDVPIAIRSSEGSELAVTPIFDAVQGPAPTVANLSVSATVDVASSGWVYVRMLDQSDGLFSLGSVVRTGGGGGRKVLSVGSPEEASEAWQTARRHFLIPSGQTEPPFERRVHLLDYAPMAGQYQYALDYLASTDCITSGSDTIALDTGGTQKLFFNPGPEYAFDTYLALGSFGASTGAGCQAGLTIPFVLDSYTSLLLGNPATFPGFIGTLDDNGRAEGTVILPSTLPSQLAGMVAKHAYVVLDPTFSVTYTSNSEPLYLIDAFAP